MRTRGGDVAVEVTRRGGGMAWSTKASLLGLLLLAGSASAVTVGSPKGRPVPGRPLEVNIPFAVDDPGERACASAGVRYGNAHARSVLEVQGQGRKRNLRVTSRANANEQPVTVQVRVGCGARAVTRSFVLAPDVSLAKAAAIMDAPPPPRRRVAEVPVKLKAAARPVALATPAEPLFPPPVVPESTPVPLPAPQPDASTAEELRKARTEAAASLAQLDATKRELAAVLDVERRTAQTLIAADHQVRDAQSEVARMRLVLKVLGAVLALGAAGAVWWEFQRVAFRRRTTRVQAQREPGILSGNEVPT